jgi:hypothetical protein
MLYGIPDNIHRKPPVLFLVKAMFDIGLALLWANGPEFA